MYCVVVCGRESILYAFQLTFTNKHKQSLVVAICSRFALVYDIKYIMLRGLPLRRTMVNTSQGSNTMIPLYWQVSVVYIRWLWAKEGRRQEAQRAGLVVLTEAISPFQDDCKQWPINVKCPNLVNYFLVDKTCNNAGSSVSQPQRFTDSRSVGLFVGRVLQHSHLQNPLLTPATAGLLDSNQDEFVRTPIKYLVVR